MNEILSQSSVNVYHYIAYWTENVDVNETFLFLLLQRSSETKQIKTWWTNICLGLEQGMDNIEFETISL